MATWTKFTRTPLFIFLLFSLLFCYPHSFSVDCAVSVLVDVSVRVWVWIWVCTSLCMNVCGNVYIVLALRFFHKPLCLMLSASWWWFRCDVNYCLLRTHFSSASQMTLKSEQMLNVLMRSKQIDGSEWEEEQRKMTRKEKGGVGLFSVMANCALWNLSPESTLQLYYIHTYATKADRILLLCSCEWKNCVNWNEYSELEHHWNTTSRHFRLAFFHISIEIHLLSLERKKVFLCQHKVVIVIILYISFHEFRLEALMTHINLALWRLMCPNERMRGRERTEPDGHFTQLNTVNFFALILLNHKTCDHSEY